MMEFVRYRLPPILVNIFATVAFLGLLGSIFFPWYQLESKGPNNCTVTDARQLFFNFYHCGSCSKEDCQTVLGTSSTGLVFQNVLVVSAVTWGCSVMSLLLVVFVGLITWLRLMDGALRYIARMFLVFALFFNLASILVYLAVNKAIDSDFQQVTGLDCTDPLGFCHKFIGNNSSFPYWGPSTGWITSCIATFFIILTTLFTLYLPGEVLNKQADADNSQ